MHFYPRTPCGVRRAECPERMSARHISIHVPRAGYDVYRSATLTAKSSFLSTYPVRGTTTAQANCTSSCCNFYPRTPCGVRRALRPLRAFKIFISIHVPRAGYDFLSMDELCPTQCISIHVPRAGYDKISPKGRDCMEDISIHVPRAGYDLYRLPVHWAERHFYPRTPCGVRQILHCHHQSNT